MMKLSLIIPTIGRDNLRMTLKTFKDQNRNGHELIVVEDGASTQKKLVEKMGFRFSYTRKSNCAGIGSRQRNLGMLMATGTHLAFLDDDDVLFPHYLEAIEYSVRDLSSLNLFKIMNHGRCLWQDQLINIGNVSTQMCVLPNYPSLPSWRADIYESDYYFIKECAEFFPVNWVDSTIAEHIVSTGENLCCP